MVYTSFRSLNVKRSLVIVALFVLGVGCTLVLLDTLHVIDFYRTPVSTTPTASDVRPVNDVQYAPATTAETDGAERIKTTAQQQSNATQTPTDNTIEVSLSAAGQDVKGGSVIVRAIVGTTAGQCALTLAGTSTSRDMTADVINLGNYYGCRGFDVPVTDVPAGTYQATVTVTNGTSSGSASQQVEVIK